MAKKTRKQKQRAAARRGAPQTSVRGPAHEPAAAGLAWETDAVAEPAAEPVVAAAMTSSDSAVAQRRRIERVSPAVAAAVARPARPGRTPANAAAMFQPLETDDAAIPFDRVPYVPADLRRVAVMAACMVLLIIVAAIIVSHVVT